MSFIKSIINRIFGRKSRRKKADTSIYPMF